MDGTAGQLAQRRSGEYRWKRLAQLVNHMLQGVELRDRRGSLRTPLRSDLIIRLRLYKKANPDFVKIYFDRFDRFDRESR